MPTIQSFSLEISVLVVALALLLAEAFFPKIDRKQFAWGAIVSLGMVFLFTFMIGSDSVAFFDRFYTPDNLAIFFKRLILLTTIGVLVMAVDYAPVVEKYTYGGPQSGLGEFFTLPLLTCAGLMWMVSATDFVMIFVSLELATISFYVLVAYLRRNAFSIEAGTKYLILGALSTGFLVYGITWIYGITGSTNLVQIGEVIRIHELPPIPLLFGFLLVVAALGFKVGAFPFQFWVPDVYQGAPTPITAFLAIGSKAAGFVVLLRVVEPFLNAPEIASKVATTLILLSALTLIFGNLAALPQDNFKRLLSYSGIAHSGFLLMGFAAIFGPATAGVYPGVGISYYLFAYFLMTMLAFLVLVVVSTNAKSDALSAFNGLGKRSPFLAGAMLISAMSLAGIPFTAGFIGKLMMFQLAISQQLWILVALGVLGAGCGFYYYFKVVRAMYWLPPHDDTTPLQVSFAIKVSIVLLMAAIVIFGIFPQPILAMLK